MCRARSKNPASPFKVKRTGESGFGLLEALPAVIPALLHVTCNLKLPCVGMASSWSLLC